VTSVIVEVAATKSRPVTPSSLTVSASPTIPVEPMMFAVIAGVHALGRIVQLAAVPLTTRPSLASFKVTTVDVFAV